MDADTVRTVVETAEQAPSVHNTQPWHFVVDRDRIDVRADRDRWLQQIDPTGRQLHLSCGAAVEFAHLAVRTLGHACTVEDGPLGDDADLLARLTIGPPQPPTETERHLATAIGFRSTTRTPYTDTPVPADVLGRLRDRANERGCWLRLVDVPRDRAVLQVLLDQAESLEMADPAYRDELARWRRSDPHAPDGVPVSAAPAWPQERVTDMPLRDFAGAGASPRPGGGDPPAVERNSVVVLGSDTDAPSDWVRSGRALALLLLTLTAEGLVAQPLGPVTDLPGTRQSLRRDLGLLGHPQMVLRIGYGTTARPTGRRDVADILDPP